MGARTTQFQVHQEMMTFRLKRWSAKSSHHRVCCVQKSHRSYKNTNPDCNTQKVRHHSSWSQRKRTPIISTLPLSLLRPYPPSRQHRQSTTHVPSAHPCHSRIRGGPHTPTSRPQRR
ncbi:hypothetical protein TGGT1_362200 [Toxoplasma gondii GT1]|uniref:Uncharacterized protein n=1 Tax=Toxoplasma gondii (strain ATCC 50853 / GT1) TaxID=507601 RepID=S7WBE9_TOXGG|nr:hypothetical protein TGGT1_362200 [Toxoplasma gondii GT1]